MEPYELAVDLAEKHDLPLSYLMGDTIREVKHNFDFLELPTDKDIDCHE